MAGVSTHVLDTAHGRGAAGMRIALYVWRGGERRHVTTTITNPDGRPNEPLLTGDQIETGDYELAFNAADYFRGAGVDLPSPPFLDQVAIRFGVSDPKGHYHVPVLISPYGYTTYRGA